MTAQELLDKYFESDVVKAAIASVGIPAGTVVLAPSIKYLERAYDASKYGEISEKPYLEVTSVPVRESAK